MQINRLFEIVYLLLEYQTVTSTELAKRFEVSTRTIYRDVETLSQAGIPIYMSKGKGGGISLLPDFILNKAVLTEQEKTDILSSMTAVSAVNLSKEGSALGKLSSIFGNKNADWIEVDFSSWGFFENDALFFEHIKTAILKKRVITFSYASGKSERLTRTVLPLKLIFKGTSWYLYGYCQMRENYRFFKLRRMDNLTVTEEIFNLPVPEHILKDQKMDTGLYIKASFLVCKEMSFRVYDEVSQFQVNDRGDFVFDLLLPDIRTICNYAATFGEYCTILSPEEAVSAMKLRLENSLKNYL